MTELASLKKQRSTIKGKLTNIIKIINTYDDKTDLEAARTRLSRVDSLLIEFTSIESKLFDIDAEQDSDLDFEEKYYIAKTKLNSFIRKRTMIPGNEIQGLDNTINNSHVGQAEVKLPKISIPQFSGDYTEWQSFFDLFSTTIHDSIMLSPVQKFQYLKGSLKDEAAALLRHISVTEANYLEALNKLKDRYDRKKHIITSFIRTFMEHPPLHTANAVKMKHLLDSADEVVRGLKALGPTAESRDPWLIYCLVSKLDDKSKCSWAETSAAKENPTLEEFFKFLQIRIDTLESLSSSSKTGSSKQLLKSHVVSSEPINNVCVFCQEQNHSLFDCLKFNSLDVNKRKEWVKHENRCFNCFSNRHVISRCTSKRRCQTCSRKHHTLIHTNVPTSENSASTTTKDATVTNLNSSIEQCMGPETTRFQAILPTALITVSDIHGTPHVCRALLDSGSQVSFISELCVQRLNLKRANSRISVSGLGLTKAGYTKGQVIVSIKPPDHPKFEITALILSKITSSLPSQLISGIPKNVWTTMQLADPEFNRPSAVDILIGADHFFSVLLDGRRHIKSEGIIFQNTIFGWVVSGRSQERPAPTSSFLVTQDLESEANLDILLKRFWELESIDAKQLILSSEEELCEQHYTENTMRNENGRFVTSLPFTKPPDDLSNTLSLSIQRLRNMERRFERDPEFKTLYHDFMQEYEQLNHMEPIPANEISSEGYYLPHHGVLRNTSSTTKLRVVFDGSARSSTGHSLNSYLAVGPTIQSSLYAIILRFREHKVALSADVEKMYRQVLINLKDTKFQKIVWRKQPSDPICHYRLLTVTYGLSSAPFLSIRCLKQISEEQKSSNQKACQEIAKSIYVDDLMTAVDSEAEGLQLKNDISRILQQYGFHLRKWSSNFQELAMSSPDQEVTNDIKEIDDTEHESASYIKLLGVSWNPQIDVFSFKSSLQSLSFMAYRFFRIATRF